MHPVNRRATTQYLHTQSITTRRRCGRNPADGRTAGDQCQQVTPLGIASGAQGELLCSRMALCSTWQGGRGGPGGHGRLSGGCGRASSGP